MFHEGLQAVLPESGTVAVPADGRRRPLSLLVAGFLASVEREETDALPLSFTQLGRFSVKRGCRYVQAAFDHLLFVELRWFLLLMTPPLLLDFVAEVAEGAVGLALCIEGDVHERLLLLSGVLLALGQLLLEQLYLVLQRDQLLLGLLLLCLLGFRLFL